MPDNVTKFGRYNFKTIKLLTLPGLKNTLDIPNLKSSFPIPMARNSAFDVITKSK